MLFISSLLRDSLGNEMQNSKAIEEYSEKLLPIVYESIQDIQYKFAENESSTRLREEYEVKYQTYRKEMQERFIGENKDKLFETVRTGMIAEKRKEFEKRETIEEVMQRRDAETMKESTGTSECARQVSLDEDRSSPLHYSTDSNRVNQTIQEEIRQRKRRQKNIIVFNVPESNNHNGNERKAYDMNVITNLITQLSVKSFEVSNCFRIGKTSEGKCRPLLIIAKNIDSKIILLRNFYYRIQVKKKPLMFLNSKLFMKQDLTKFQQKCRQTDLSENKLCAPSIFDWFEKK